MSKPLFYILFFLGWVVLFSFSSGFSPVEKSQGWMRLDTLPPTPKLRYRLRPKVQSPLLLNQVQSRFHEHHYRVPYDAFQNELKTSIADPSYIDKETYLQRRYRLQMQQYFQRKTDASRGLERKERGKGKYKEGDKLPNLLPTFRTGWEFQKTIFGSDEIELIPKGYFTVRIGGLYQYTDNPTFPENTRGSFSLDLDQRIQLNLDLRLGEKYTLKGIMDTKALFDFQNYFNTAYTGEEDDIIKKIELGNVTMSYKNSLMTDVQQLLGGKIRLQFGDTFITTAIAKQNSKSKTVNAQGGGVLNDFSIRINDYDEDKHFFLGQYFYEHFDRALAELPLINSQINITRLEVWVTNSQAQVDDVRNIIAFTDMGSSTLHTSKVRLKAGNQTLPRNANNTLDPEDVDPSSPLRDIAQAANQLDEMQLRETSDYVRIENAKRLNPNEYSFHPLLGYFSINQRLRPNQALAVAFEYIYNGEVYKVGELSTDGISADKNILAKLIRSNAAADPSLPSWKWMMKNVYKLAGYDIQQDGFRLDVLYANDETGTPLNYLTDGPLKESVLLRVFDLDQLDKLQTPQPDGYFDFLDQKTIDARNGLIILPSVAPFGDFLKQKLNGDQKAIAKYVYQDLYTKNKVDAKEQSKYNKFILQGRFKSSQSSTISLGAINVARGSVKVTAGGRPLVEGQDYTINYQSGQVKIINQVLIDARTPISVSLENSDVFGSQNRIFFGLEVEHFISDEFSVNFGLANLSETPFTPKINVGKESVNNLLLSGGAAYETDALWLTRWVDAIPFIETKEMSKISVSGELAYLIPGSPSQTKQGGEPISYLDDFEGSQAYISLSRPSQWVLSSTPAGTLFPEGSQNDSFTSGANRAKFAWYSIDPFFFGSSSEVPAHLTQDLDQLQHPNFRQFTYKELFPNRDLSLGEATIIRTMDLAFYPSQRGPYNYDAKGFPGVSEGLNTDGTLKKPESRWGGVMAQVFNTNFEAANVEFIEFWMMDPFFEKPDHEGGTLYFHLGNLSEDVIRDGAKSYENGLPESSDDDRFRYTKLAKIPTRQVVNRAFDNAFRLAQDLGLDGMGNAEERIRFQEYLKEVNTAVTDPQARSRIDQDPSGDDYHYYRGSDFDGQKASFLERYKNFNNTEGNSKLNASEAGESYVTAATSLPDIEDLDLDNTINRDEAYHEYKIPLSPQQLVNHPYVQSTRTLDIQVRGVAKQVTWYQFKIPIFKPTQSYKATNFRNVRFVRMLLKDFKESALLRMVDLKLTRENWRRYRKSLIANDGVTSIEDDATLLEISALNVNENATRSPIPYVLPPGIDREQIFNTAQVQAQNEQSMVLRIKDLKGGDGRAVFKTFNTDLRNYKRLKAFVHAEKISTTSDLTDKDMSFFIRLGNDLSENYYQYEIPLYLTPWGSTAAGEIWKKQNEMDVALQEFLDLKIERNRDQKVSRSQEYRKKKTNGKTIVVKGSPNLGSVQTIMLGVKNNANSGIPKDVEVWINELRLGGREQSGGWAARASTQIKLADFSKISFNTQRTSIGFGAVAQPLQERSLTDNFSYDANMSMNLHKFFPNSWRLNIPITLGYSEKFITPKYNPLIPDVPFEQSLASYDTQSRRDSVTRIIEDYTRQRSLNLENVGKLPNGDERFYSVENFSASFGISQLFKSSPTTEFYNDELMLGKLRYKYNRKNSGFQIFSFFEGVPVLDGFKNVKISLLPKSYLLQAGFRRRFVSEKFRNLDNPDFKVETFYNKKFTLEFEQMFEQEVVTGVRITYKNKAIRAVDEPPGEINTPNKRGLLFERIRSLGRPLDFHQDFNISYTPLWSKLAFLSWVKARFTFNTAYDWTSGPQALKTPEKNLGNTIQSKRSYSQSYYANMKDIYKHFSWIKDAQNRVNLSPATDNSDQEGADFLDYLVNFFTSINRISLSTTTSYSQVFDGFLPNANLYGYGFTSFGAAPNLQFMFGDLGYLIDRYIFNEPRAARDLITEEEWLTKSPLLNTPAKFTNHFKGTYQISFKPIPFLDISFTGKLQQTTFEHQIIKYDKDSQQYKHFNPKVGGSTDFSFWMMPTSLLSGRSIFSTPDLYYKMKAARKDVAYQIAEAHYGTTDFPLRKDGYPKGFGPKHQRVLIGSFVSAYSGTNTVHTHLPVRRSVTPIPLPNWTIRYSGLRNISVIKEYFSQFNLSHTYRSIYTLANFTSNLEYDPNQAKTNREGDFIDQQSYNTVALTENFAPLIRLDLTTKNLISANFGLNTSRSMTLSIPSEQISEIYSQEYQMGLGYVIKDIGFSFDIYDGRRYVMKSDLDIKGSFSIKKTRNFVRKLADDDLQTVSGQSLISFKANASYNIMPRLNFQVYFDISQSDYATSNAYPLFLSRGGFSLKYIIGN